MKHRLFIHVAFVVLAALAFSSVGAHAQGLPSIVIDHLPTVSLEPLPSGYPSTTAPSAAGPYYAVPAWDQTLPPNVRFIILTNFDSDAVLDRETGLVWARRQLSRMTMTDALNECENLVVGRRSGWRLPSVAELKSLLDFSAPPVADTPRLPAGHPFALTPVLSGSDVTYLYWTSALIALVDDSPSFFDNFGRIVSFETGAALHRFLDERYPVLCVRGVQ